MKVLITGSRDVKDLKKVHEILDKELGAEDVIIHGGAEGVDSCAQAWAENNKQQSIIVRPVNHDAESYLRRNCEMIAVCERVIAIWNGRSRGTKFTMDYASKRYKPISTHYIE